MPRHAIYARTDIFYIALRNILSSESVILRLIVSAFTGSKENSPNVNRAISRLHWPNGLPVSSSGQCHITASDKAKPSYIGGILEMANARLYPFWANLTEGLKTGEPQNEAKAGGSKFFEVLYSDPARLVVGIK